LKNIFIFVEILQQHYKEPPLNVVEMNNIFQARIEEIFSMDAEAKKQIPTIQVPQVYRYKLNLIFFVQKFLCKSALHCYLLFLLLKGHYHMIQYVLKMCP
jgi:hypothetical protein